MGLKGQLLKLKKGINFFTHTHPHVTHTHTHTAAAARASSTIHSRAGCLKPVERHTHRAL